MSGGDSDDMTSHQTKLNVIDSDEDGDDDVASKKKRDVSKNSDDDDDIDDVAPKKKGNVSKNSDDEDDDLDDEDVSIRQMLHQRKILYLAA